MREKNYIQLFIEQKPTESRYFPDCCKTAEAIVRIKTKKGKSLTIEDIVRLEWCDFEIFITNQDDYDKDEEKRRKDAVWQNRDFKTW